MEHEDKRDNSGEACGQDHCSRLIASAAPAIRERVFERPDVFRKLAGLDDDALDRVMALAEAGTPREAAPTGNGRLKRQWVAGWGKRGGMLPGAGPCRRGVPDGLEALGR